MPKAHGLHATGEQRRKELARDCQRVEHQRVVGEEVCAALRDKMPRLERIWADGGYAGQLVDWVSENTSWNLELVKRPAAAKGFVLLPKRWIVERTFAWLYKYRRLREDYEETIASSEALIRLAMMRLMLRRLRRT